MYNSNIAIAESYVLGLKNRDFSNVPLATDVIFKGPLSDNEIHGAAALTEFLTGLFPLVKDARVLRSFGADDHVCVLWEFEVIEPAVVIPICEYFRVVDGRLTEVRPFYDPRPLTNPA